MKLIHFSFRVMVRFADALWFPVIVAMQASDAGRKEFAARRLMP